MISFLVNAHSSGTVKYNYPHKWKTNILHFNELKSHSIEKKHQRVFHFSCFVNGKGSSVTNIKEFWRLLSLARCWWKIWKEKLKFSMFVFLPFCWAILLLVYYGASRNDSVSTNELVLFEFSIFLNIVMESQLYKCWRPQGNQRHYHQLTKQQPNRLCACFSSLWYLMILIIRLVCLIASR